MLETNHAFKQNSEGGSRLIELTEELVGRVQQTLFEMLQQVDQICGEHDLTYVLLGGSALGAVRHEGFIPWDDDIDIGMPRHDYNRFYQIIKAEYAETFWVQNIQEDERYDLNFMKIRAVGTKFQEVFDTEPEISGFFIDVYPIENLPDAKFMRSLHRVIVDGLQFCASCVRIREKQERLSAFFSLEEMGRTIKIKTQLGKWLSFRSLYQWCRSIDKWAAKVKNEQSVYVGIPVGRNHYAGEIYRRDKILPGRRAPFEKKWIPIPADPCYYLEKMYGDYTKIPPVEEREKHSILALKFKGE